MSPPGLCSALQARWSLERRYSPAPRPLRNALLKQAWEIVARDAPSIGGFATRQVLGMSKKLHHPRRTQTEALTLGERTGMEP